MRKHLIFVLSLLSGFSNVAWANTPGEYWEVTSKTEMEGMPLAMPSQTIKVCVPKGQSLDPREANKGQDCQFSDYKANSQKVSYSFRCIDKGTVMTGNAEYNLGVNKSEGVMHMRVKSNGQDMKMTQFTSSKLVGGSCDPDKLARENNERLEKMKREQTANTEKECDTSAYTTEMWIENSWKFTHNNHTCPPGNQQKEMCAAINQDVSRNVNVFTKMAKNDDLIGICKVNIKAATKSICKTLNESNLQQLTPYCPAEVKALREAKRRKKCQGREYSAETAARDMKRCMAGGDEGGRDYSAEPTSPSGTKKPNDNASGANGTVNNVLEGANKLKRVFGF